VIPPGRRRISSSAGSRAGPDQLWVADLTCIPTWAGFLYLAIVLDAWSRRVIGWAVDRIFAPSPSWPRWTWLSRTANRGT
jgi:transposase InsO family protein